MSSTTNPPSFMATCNSGRRSASSTIPCGIPRAVGDSQTSDSSRYGVATGATLLDGICARAGVAARTATASSPVHTDKDGQGSFFIGTLITPGSGRLQALRA